MCPPGRKRALSDGGSATPRLTQARNEIPSREGEVQRMVALATLFEEEEKVAGAAATADVE